MNGQLELPAGFRFHPTDEELVKHYLCRRCAAQSIAVPIIREIDLYKFDPWVLPGISSLFPNFLLNSIWIFHISSLRLNIHQIFRNFFQII